MTDIAYILSWDSSGEYKDFKYSLRSLDRYCKDIGNLYIVGCLPKWFKRGLDEAHHIPFEDTYQAWCNHILKCRELFGWVCNLKEYLLMNDDFFMTAPFKAKEYPLFNRGKITGTGETNYNRILLKTKDFVEKYRPVALHYGVHCPILYKADIFTKAYDRMCDYGDVKLDTQIGYDFRCLYGNEIGGGLEVKDTKCYKKLDYCDNLCHCVSSSDECDNSILESIFKEKSRWEK